MAFRGESRVLIRQAGGAPVTRRLPAPDLIRGLQMYHEAPDQVRGGVATNVNTTLTRIRNHLEMLTFPILTTVVTA